MIFGGKGYVKNNLYVTGFAWSPAYLYAGERPAIFEAGFYCMGRIYEDDIKKILNNRDPELLFLTHVHYDHCGAVSYLKKVFPKLKVLASRRASDIISRPNARQLMINLSANSIEIIKQMDGIDSKALLKEPFEPFEIDEIISEGDIIKLEDGISIHVFATPGHTRDMLSYYIPEKKILIATESVGCLGNSGRVVTEFLVDYDVYISSLKRLASLDIDVLCQGHHFVFTDRDVRLYLSRSIKEAEIFREHVERLLKLYGGSVEKVVAQIKAEEYDTNKGTKQPEKAYLLNLTARVTHLAERHAKKLGTTEKI